MVRIVKTLLVIIVALAMVDGLLAAGVFWKLLGPQLKARAGVQQTLEATPTFEFSNVEGGGEAGDPAWQIDPADPNFVPPL